MKFIATIVFIATIAVLAQWEHDSHNHILLGFTILFGGLISIGLLASNLPNP